MKKFLFSLYPNRCSKRDNSRSLLKNCFAGENEVLGWLLTDARFLRLSKKSLMIEDEVLKWKFRHGSTQALRRIYQKYRDYLLTLAIALSNDVHLAEDVVHDVFVNFVISTESFKLQGSLKGYLATCVANRARDYLRRSSRYTDSIEEATLTLENPDGPDQLVISSEQSEQLNKAIARLPAEQREAVVLHLVAGLKFREIAQLQTVTANTAKGRYRYGLKKLRSILNT